MAHIPDSHPRAASLRLRQRLEDGLLAGIVTPTGLIAHGRGEAYDYLLGEWTHPFAERALAAASATILLATHPSLTVNGNVVALLGPELVAFAERHANVAVEVNVFHHSPERVETILRHLHALGLHRVLHFSQVATPGILPGLESMRRFLHPAGVGKADVVIVALEDGDRCQALVNSGRTVLAIDLNPLSRTAQMATVSIVDELTRTVARLDRQLLADRTVSRAELAARLAEYDNAAVLRDAESAIRGGFRTG